MKTLMNIRNSNKSIASYRWEFAFSVIIAGMVLTNLALGFEQHFGIDQKTVSYLLKLIIFAVLCWCIPTALNRNILPVLYTLIIITIVITLQYTVFPDLNYWFNDLLLDFMTIVFPAIICIDMMHDEIQCITYLLKISIILSVINAVLLILYGGSLFDRYSMGYSNALILPTNALILALRMPPVTKRAKLLCCACIITNCMAILLFGSRGALVSICIFAIFCLMRSRKSCDARIITYMGILFIAVITIILFDEIIVIISSISSEFRLNSRTLNLLTSREMLFDSGRGEMWGIVADDCLNNPLLPKGIASMYPLVNGYSHSIILDLLHSCGFIIGGLLLLFILGRAAATLHNINLDKPLELLLFFSAFPLLLWSGTLWNNLFFWGWIILSSRRNSMQ